MNPLDRSSINKQDILHDNIKYKAEESTYSFVSQTNKICPAYPHIQKSSTSPLRSKYFTPCEDYSEHERNGDNSECESRSRSRSGFRKMSHSPINVNTSYEISHKNTENLWKEFCSNVKERSSSKKQNALRVRDIYKSNVDIQRQPLSNLQPKINNQFEGTYNHQVPPECRLINEKQKYSYIDSKHLHKISATSNFDTNRFIETSKSEEMNKVMNERNLKKLIQVTGEDSIKEQIALKSNFSFDRNSQMFVPFGQNDSVGNKASHASQFTFNSTDKNGTRDLDSCKNQPSKICDFVKDTIRNEIKHENKSRIKIFTGPNTFEGSREIELDQKEYPIMNTVRQILHRDESKSNHDEISSNYYSKKMDSKESTTAIRERLKNKINNLREKINTSQNNTIRSVQENLKVPVDKMNQNYDAIRQPVETMRIHSRDGSKSIEGSGLELDEFVNSCDDKVQFKNGCLDKIVNISSKHDTFNTVSYQGESVRSANTFQSKNKYDNELKNRDNGNKLNNDNQSFTNTKKLEHYFTIEDLKNSREGGNPDNPNIHKCRNKERKRENSKEIIKIASLNTTTQLQKTRKPYRFQSSKASNKASSSHKNKAGSNYSGNSSINHKSHSKNKSSNRMSIKSVKSKISHSQKRSSKNEKLMNYSKQYIEKSFANTSPNDVSSSEADEILNNSFTPNKIIENQSYK